jgi:formylmethanofuran dehydrogenase subunit E
MGQQALTLLSSGFGSFDLDVVHRTPLEVQYSCIADGVQAATGVSAGKLNLRIEKATVEQMQTIVRNKKTGQEVVFRLKPEALSHFLDLPHEALPAAGREVMIWPDDQLFSADKR